MTIALIAIDEITRHSLEEMGAELSLHSRFYPSITTFLGNVDAPLKAIIINIDQGEGVDFNTLQLLRQEYSDASLIVLSRHQEVENVVAAMQAGAADFWVIPLDAGKISLRLHALINHVAFFPDTPARKPSLKQRVAPVERLTLRERDVLTHLIDGASNKEIGRLLTISPRTVEVHRARIMQKLNARNAADLVRLVLGEG
jgi:two-component system, LuxR family, response regulator FixJ